MKKGVKIPVAFLVVAVLIVSLFACSGPNNPLTEKTEIIKGGIAKEVSPGVYDTGNGTVFVQAEPLRGNDPAEKRVADLITKKEAWEKMFPEKRIIAMADIVRGSTYTDGIIIHYVIEK